MDRERRLVSKLIGYKPEDGDEFVEIQNLRPEHIGRIFEARNQEDGSGVIGYLEDANHYLLDGVVGIRFFGRPLGIFDKPDAQILMKREGYEHPGLGDPPRRPSPGVSGRR
jgi:hypothetical protein